MADPVESGTFFKKRVRPEGGYRVACLDGDGIGPEVVQATRAVLEATGVPFTWVPVSAGVSALALHGSAMPEETMRTIKECDATIKGPTSTPIGTGHTSANVELRKALELYANLRPVQSLPGVPTRYEGVDLVIVRENTEDLYAGIEHVVVPGVVESLKIITEKASLRIAEFAFSYAQARGRRKVTAVHKANIMKLSDGLFLNCCRRVATKYSSVQYDECIVDNLCMQLVKDPTRYDVLVLENLYGDIVSDLCAGLVGGLGVVPGANLGDKTAVFEAVHGSAPDIAGKGVANPTAIVLSGAMLLEYLGEAQAAKWVRKAIDEVYSKTRIRTPDLGGPATTDVFTHALIDQVKRFAQEAQ
jgi:isocitrate dehydrogenase (NAD+)